MRIDLAYNQTTRLTQSIYRRQTTFESYRQKRCIIVSKLSSLIIEKHIRCSGHRPCLATRAFRYVGFHLIQKDGEPRLVRVKDRLASFNLDPVNG